ncbi:MAG: tyrosine-type recombinase/integrase [Chloroflexi bacterium]|nr:tyrosine-type recombinase/integrase [Chloroflexota bacterium]
MAAKKRRGSVDVSVAPDYWVLAKSFERSLLAANRSPATIRIYMTSVQQLGAFLDAQKMPLVLAHLTREHVEEYIADVLKRNKPASAETRYRGLKAFFKWAEEEGEITTSPMAKMKRPTVSENPPPVLADEQVAKLLAACEGKGFEERRDMAILRLFIDTGMRRSELAHMTTDDLDLELRAARVVGKGRRPRACPFGRKTTQALDRYLRVRAQHAHADEKALWLGRLDALPLRPDQAQGVCRQRRCVSATPNSSEETGLSLTFGEAEWIRRCSGGGA